MNLHNIENSSRYIKNYDLSIVIMIMHTIIDTGDSQTPDVINFSFNEKNR